MRYPKAMDKAAIDNKFAWIPIRVNWWDNKTKIVWLKTIYHVVLYVGKHPNGSWSDFGWSESFDYVYGEQF